MPSMKGTILAAGLLAIALPALAQTVPVKTTPDLVVHSTVANVNRGVIASDLPPVAHIKSGQTVMIETISHQGLTEDPVAFFAGAGIPSQDVLPDAVAVAKRTYEQEKGAPADRNAFRGHVLTGPIYIDGAEPGDMLEVRMVGFKNRVNYGVNSIGPGGAAPGLVTTSVQKIIKVDPARGKVLFAKDIEPDMDNFMGIMAVAPPPSMGARVSSGPPGVFGGNMDFKRLSQGASLYLPVFNRGALFVTGDSHAAMGDGEVTGNALESSLDATLQFVLHKGEGAKMHFPRAEDADNYYVMGIDADLRVAMKDAVEETNAFLREKFGLSASDAYSLSSIAVDYAVAEDVDANRVIYGRIPKKMFTKKEAFWSSH
jgi:acetamidase/formamidase